MCRDGIVILRGKINSRVISYPYLQSEVLIGIVDLRQREWIVEDGWAAEVNVGDADVWVHCGLLISDCPWLRVGEDSCGERVSID